MSFIDNLRTAARVVTRGKSALYDLHPELEGRVHVSSTVTDELVLQRGQGFKQATADYAQRVWVQKAVRVLANNVAPLPVRVVGAEDEEVPGHAVTDLLARVNEHMSPGDLWLQWTTDMMLGGECGLEVVKGTSGGLMELWPRQPQQFSVLPDLARKRYYGVAGYRVRFDDMDKGFELGPDEFIHLKFYNPANPWRGLSPIRAVSMGIVIDQLAQAWSAMFFENGARPDFAVIAPQGITPSEKGDLERRLMEKFGGVGGAHKPIVLEEGITDIKTFSWAAKDTEWLAQREMSRDEVGAVFGVPDEIMGYGRDTYENFDAAMTMVWTLTLVPLVGYRDSTLTEFFRRTGQLKPGQRVATDLNNVSQLQEDFTEKLTQAEKLFAMGYTPNEINERLMLGMPETEMGDAPFAGRGVASGPFGMTPTRTLSRPVTKDAAPAYNSAAHQLRMKEIDERQEPFIVRMQRELKRQIQRQEIEVGRRLRNNRSLGKAKGLDDADVKQNVNDLFDLQGEIAAFKTAFRALVANMLEEAGNAELGGLDVGMALDIERPEVQAAIDEVLNEMAMKVNDTTYTELVDLFRDAEAAGESIPEIQERLSSYFNGRKSDASTERIARTTMTGADNRGAMEAYVQSEVVSGTVWLASIDDRTREAHIAAHGQRRALGDPFYVGDEDLRHPGDPRGSAGNIINCRCAVMPVVE